MVKLATARESRMYGPRLGRNRSEYINAGLYVFAAIVLLSGFMAQFSREPKSGLVLLLIALALIVGVNLHDLLAHLAGIDYRLSLMEFDSQLALVEFAVPVVQVLGSTLYFLGVLFLFIQLATARESRMYGPRLGRNRSEYINAGLYVFAAIVLLSGFVAQFSREPKSGLVLLLIALALIVGVNLHDLLAHLAGIDYRLSLMEFDSQLALVEFAVPVVQVLGSTLYFLGVLFLFIQAEKGYGYFKLERHALNMLIAGPVLWLLGSIHNSCQIYERADGHVQILQQSVHIPFLMGSLLFLVGAILNSREQDSSLIHHGIESLGRTWVWLGIAGSLLFFIGGLTNVVKVFKMQQIDGLRLEKLRGGAQDRLIHEREGQVPLIIEEHRRRKTQIEEVPPVVPGSTPYKDVLVGQT